MAEREHGIVKWFDSRKGYGFIERDRGGEEISVHFREIQGKGFKTLREGQRVEFGLADRGKGSAAEQVAALE